MVELNIKTAEISAPARAIISNPKYGEMLEMNVNYKSKPIYMGKKKVMAVLLNLDAARAFVAGKMVAEQVDWTEKVKHEKKLF